MEGLKPAIPVGGREHIALLTKDLVSSCPNFGMTLSITCLLFVKTLNHDLNHELSGEKSEVKLIPGFRS
jgi:hypothetical protein